MNKVINDSKQELDTVLETLLDPLAIKLTNSINWINLKGISTDSANLYPVAILGKGKPILLLHGFDSCFMEFRRLAPYLERNYKLIIPDLYGFGFCPRPIKTQYGIESILSHLDNVLTSLKIQSNIGIIGASMGGGIAMKFARLNKNKINKILLLSPAGLTGKSVQIPSPLDYLGVFFLKQKCVREGLCRNAFSNPKDVGPSEKQIASIHLNVPGWARSLAAFARGGGVADCGLPIPTQTTKIIWGKDDRILNQKLRNTCQKLLNCSHEEIDHCGHLPHIDRPELVAKLWKELDKSD